MRIYMGLRQRQKYTNTKGTNKKGKCKSYIIQYMQIVKELKMCLKN